MKSHSETKKSCYIQNTPLVHVLDGTANTDPDTRHSEQRRIKPTNIIEIVYYSCIQISFNFMNKFVSFFFIDLVFREFFVISLCIFIFNTMYGVWQMMYFLSNYPFTYNFFYLFSNKRHNFFFLIKINKIWIYELWRMKNELLMISNQKRHRIWSLPII